MPVIVAVPRGAGTGLKSRCKNADQRMTGGGSM
jgi:hypothetical protein